MPDGYTTITDAPVELAATADGQPTRSRIHVAQLGTYNDRRYGRFAIDQRRVDNWKRLLAEHFNGRVPIDRDHSTDKGGSSEAWGWITSLQQDGQDIMADVEWTPAGEQAIREKRYLYISPTFVEELRDQEGKSLGPALLRAALTNTPFLHRMPAISLSGPVLAAQVDDDHQLETKRDPSAGDEHHNVKCPKCDTVQSATHSKCSNCGHDLNAARRGKFVNLDNRPTMPLPKKILDALGLPEDADDDQVIGKIGDLKKKGEPKKTDTLTLEAQASAEGKVILDAAAHAKLEQQAAAGEQAAQTLHTQRFEQAYRGALDAGRVDAKPETRERFEGLYRANADLTVQTLDALPVTVNLTARGSGGDTTATPDGYDDESYKLDQRVQSRMSDKGEDYTVALNAVLAEDERMVA